jgi:hypothetical protein
MKTQQITAVTARWSCREKRPDPFDLCGASNVQFAETLGQPSTVWSSTFCITVRPSERKN